MKAFSWYAGEDLENKPPEIGYYFYKQGKVLSLAEVREIVDMASIGENNEFTLDQMNQVKELGILWENVNQGTSEFYKRQLNHRFAQFKSDLTGFSDVAWVIFDFVVKNYTPDLKPGSPAELFEKVYDAFRLHSICVKDVNELIENKMRKIVDSRR